MSNAPHPLTAAEWKEVCALAEVREIFGIEDEGDEKVFADFTCAARFDYQSDFPGYRGDVFVILGGIVDCPPITLAREDGRLVVVGSSLNGGDE